MDDGSCSHRSHGPPSRDDILAVQREQSLAYVARSAVHDINNLLACILGSVTLLRDRVGSEPGIGALCEQIAMSTGKISDLAHQILTYARGGSGASEVIDVNGTVAEALAIARGVMPPGIDVRVDLVPAPAAVEVEPTQLSQVLLNLLVNAVEAMPQGGCLRVRTALEPRSAAGGGPPGGASRDEVCIEVGDTGCGIEPEVAERLWEPFFSTKAEGRGLGLTAVQHIVRAHGGRLEVESQPGEGATFRVLLPRSSRTPRQVKREEPVRGGRETILVVDDEPAVCEITRRFLEGLGYSVCTAGSGRRAVELLHERGASIELALLDLQLPDIGGGDLIAAVRREDPSVGILLSTGHDPLEPEIQQVLARASGFVKKPYTRENLAAEVRRVLDGRGGEARMAPPLREMGARGIGPGEMGAREMEAG
ncbi:MAG: ATP-binding protein [Planctomycetota bacterium]